MNVLLFVYILASTFLYLNFLSPVTTTTKRDLKPGGFATDNCLQTKLFLTED